jgi:hypothetical protein
LPFHFLNFFILPVYLQLLSDDLLLLFLEQLMQRQQIFFEVDDAQVLGSLLPAHMAEHLQAAIEQRTANR